MQKTSFLGLPPPYQWVFCKVAHPRDVVLTLKGAFRVSALPQGPLSVFSAKNKWYPVRRVHLMRGENGFGFTLRGDSPVLIAGVIPGGCAAVSTLGLCCPHGDAGKGVLGIALRGTRWF